MGKKAILGSWRYAVLLTSVIGLVTVPTWIFLRWLGDPGASVMLLLAPGVAGASLLLHELGHVVAYAKATPAGGRTATMTGSWVSVTLEREPLPLRQEVGVSVAGPLVGAAPPLAIATLAGPGVIGPSVFVGIAAFHLASLLPGQHDYASIRQALAVWARERRESSDRAEIRRREQ